MFRVQLECEERYLAVLQDIDETTEESVTEINIMKAMV